jgi:glutathione reductase (NADPH)
MAARFGARVAVAEERYFGGTCVNVGCIPKKLLVYAAEFADHYREAEGFGWEPANPAHSWSKLRQNMAREIARLSGVYQRILSDAGCTLFDGRARLVGPHEVEIDGKRVSAANIMIATGGWPTPADFAGAQHTISSNELFSLPELPPSGEPFCRPRGNRGNRCSPVYRS